MADRRFSGGGEFRAARIAVFAFGAPGAFSQEKSVDDL
jgi:hypothetical protein